MKLLWRAYNLKQQPIKPFQIYKFHEINANQPIIISSSMHSLTPKKVRFEIIFWSFFRQKSNKRIWISVGNIFYSFKRFIIIRLREHGEEKAWQRENWSNSQISKKKIGIFACQRFCVSNCNLSSQPKGWHLAKSTITHTHTHTRMLLCLDNC